MLLPCCDLNQQELHRRYEGTPESTKTKALQTVIDMKVKDDLKRRMLSLFLDADVIRCILTPLYRTRMPKLTPWKGT